MRKPFFSILNNPRSIRNFKQIQLILSSVFLVGTFVVGLDSHLGYLFLVVIILTLGENVRSPVTQSFVSHYAPRDARSIWARPICNLRLTVFLSAWFELLAIFILLLDRIPDQYGTLLFSF